MRVKGKKVRLLDQDFVPEDTLYAVVNSFNQMYGYVFRYMVREVGPHRGERAREVRGRLRDARKAVFGGVKLQKDGTLDAALIERNLNHIPEDRAAQPAGRRPQRAAVRGAAGGEAHARHRARSQDRARLPRPVSRAQVRGAVILLALALLWSPGGCAQLR